MSVINKENWIYQIKGMAIIAVVVCHQGTILHYSQTIQLFTLYAVPIFILCAGITRSYSLSNKSFSQDTCKLSTYLLKSLTPLLYSYFFATLFMSIINGWNGSNILDLWNHLLSFNSSGSYYFIKYYICLTLLSPILFAIIKSILLKSKNQILKNIFITSFLLCCFGLGYFSIDILECLGASYLFLYSLGLVIGYLKPNFFKYPFYLLAVGSLFIGFISTRRFYFERVDGNMNYSGGINIFTPKLQLNPPNLSIILYSIGCFFLFYYFFHLVEIYQNSSILGGIIKCITLFGRYSLDIYLYHLFIQKIYLSHFNFIENIWIKRCVLYSIMFFLPILGRILYLKYKNRLYKLLSNY